jgi:hypothetical protein
MSTTGLELELLREETHAASRAKVNELREACPSRSGHDELDKDLAPLPAHELEERLAPTL